MHAQRGNRAAILSIPVIPAVASASTGTGIASTVIPAGVPDIHDPECSIGIVFRLQLLIRHLIGTETMGIRRPWFIYVNLQALSPIGAGNQFLNTKRTLSR